MTNCNYHSLLRKSMFTDGEIDYKTQNYDIYTMDGKYWATVTLFIQMTREAMFKWILQKYPNSSIVLHDRVKIVPAFEGFESDKGFFANNPFSAEEKKRLREEYAQVRTRLLEGRTRDCKNVYDWYHNNLERAKENRKNYYRTHKDYFKEYHRKKQLKGKSPCAKVIIQKPDEC